MSYFEKLRHFVARILDKGRRVRAWISSIFTKKKTEPSLEEQIDSAKKRVEQEIDVSIKNKIPMHYDGQGKIGEDTFYKKFSDFKHYERPLCCYGRLGPDSRDSQVAYCIEEDKSYNKEEEDSSTSWDNPCDILWELRSSLSEQFKKGAEEISSRGNSYYEEVYEAVILYYDIIYNKEINKTSVENLHRLPYIDLSRLDHRFRRYISLMSFFPTRYSFNQYKAGKVSLSVYVRALVEFGNLICFKTYPEWGMIFVMELILFVLGYYPAEEEEKDILCLNNFLREESFIPTMLEIENESKEMKEYTVRKKELAEKALNKLNEYGIFFGQKRSDALDFIGASIKYYDKIFRWKHQWNEKGFTHPDFIECSNWEEVRSIWKDFKGKKAVISKQVESSCDCLKQPPAAVLDQMKKYQKFTTDRITIKKRFKSLRDVKKISPYS